MEIVHHCVSAERVQKKKRRDANRLQFGKFVSIKAHDFPCFVGIEELDASALPTGLY